MKSNGGHQGKTHTPALPEAGSRSGQLSSSVGVLDKGQYERANKSVVDERICGDCRAREDAMRFNRVSTNGCLSNEGLV